MASKLSSIVEMLDFVGIALRVYSSIYILYVGWEEREELRNVEFLLNDPEPILAKSQRNTVTKNERRQASEALIDVLDITSFER